MPENCDNMPERIKKLQETPEKPESPQPAITPDMIQTTFRALETKGMIYYSEGGVYVPTEKGWKLLMSVASNKEEIIASGASAIIANNKNSFAIIKAKEIRLDKDSVIAVNANKAADGLNPEFKRSIKDINKKLEITIEADGIEDIITAYGSPALKINSDKAVVVRKDDFIDGRVLAILADKSAADLDRSLIEKLKDPKTKVKITLGIKYN